MYVCRFCQGHFEEKEKMNLFKRGQNSKEALDIGLTKERKIEILEDIKKRTEATFWHFEGDEPERLKDIHGDDHCKIIKITTSFYDWEEGLPSRVVELWSEDISITEKYLKWLEWDFCLESLKPIAIEVIQTSPNDKITSPNKGKLPKILYRHQYIIKQGFEDLLMGIL